ncbi:MAG: protein jag [Clostridia bacterium]|nr:protein jag [Clostridia bacterium]
MSNTVEISAKNIDLAVKRALEQLQCSRDDVEIEVLDSGRAGILGIGSRDAVVRVTRKETEAPAETAAPAATEPVAETVPEESEKDLTAAEERAIAFLTETTKNMGVPASVTTSLTEEALTVELSGENMGVLIGHHGETLDALQYLTSLLVNRNQENYTRVILDTENYREKRAAALAQLAKRTASRAVRTGRVALEPMNPYERRILHTTLQDHPDVTTYSEGEEPYRRVIVVRK